MAADVRTSEMPTAALPSSDGNVLLNKTTTDGQQFGAATMRKRRVKVGKAKKGRGNLSVPPSRKLL